MSKSSKSQSSSAKLDAVEPHSSEVNRLSEKALSDVKKTSSRRLKHSLPENSEPSLVFQIRPGATQQW